MTFFVILIAVLFQWFSAWGEALQRFDIFEHYWKGLRRLMGSSPLWGGYGDLVIAILPLLIIVEIIEYLTLDWGFNLPELLFGLLALLYCLKVSNVRIDLKEFFAACKKEDWKAAAGAASQFSGSAVQANEKAVAKAVINSLLNKSLIWVFGVVFWFFLFGPEGALLYCFIENLVGYVAGEKKPLGPALKGKAAALKAIFDWVPQRLAAVSFALAGQFGPAFNSIVKLLPAGLKGSEEKYLDAGFDALEFESNLKANGAGKVVLDGVKMLERAVIIWLVVMAMITLW